MLKRPKEFGGGGGTWGGGGFGGRSSPQASVILIIKVKLQRRFQDWGNASPLPV